jgi:putative aldouronate transport system substrate-binding protein
MTPDELFTALQQCVAQNVSGKGANNTFAWGVFSSGPGATASQSPFIGIFTAFFDKNTLTEEMRATMPSTPSQPSLFWPGTKEATRFMNKMYNAGLMDPDFALQRDHQQFMARVANGQVGFFTATDGHGTSESDPNSNYIYLLYQNDPTAEFVGLQLLNNQTREPSYRYSYPPTGMVIMVPSFSRAAPQALQYLNWLCQEEKAGDVIHGVEGEHWRWANGIREPINIEHNNNTRISLGDLTIMYNGSPDPAMDLAQRLAALSNRHKPLLQAYYDLGNTNTYTDYVFSQEIVSETKYNSNLQAKSNEIYTQAIMARPQDFDSVWDRLTREFLVIGGQEVIDERTAAYRNR